MMKWSVDSRQYANGTILHLGSWIVGGVHYDGTTSRDSRDKFRANCKLPGISSLGPYETEEQAKDQVEKAVLSWLKAARLMEAG